jgi:hypothetical protein
VELRSAVRYPIRASVVFTWRGPRGPLQGEGVTRDISIGGIYIRTPTSPPDAVALQMEIFLPLLVSEGKRLRVLGKGQVVRVEQSSADDAQSGFAALLQGPRLSQLSQGN